MPTHIHTQEIYIYIYIYINFISHNIHIKSISLFHNLVLGAIFTNITVEPRLPPICMILHLKNDVCSHLIVDFISLRINNRI